MTSLKKAVVFYADHTYLVLFAPGERVPANTAITFPVDMTRQQVFAFTLGQMPGLSFDEADFEELISITLDDLPDLDSTNGLVDVHVSMDVREDSALYVELSFTTDQNPHFYMPMYPLYGPLPLD
ncbi:MAG: hypothetical protein SF029_16035 [bacterium]|nr:hypothetical protein [bacterium]